MPLSTFRPARRHGFLTEREARALVRAAKGRPEEAAALHRRAIRLREAIYQIFSAMARERPPGAEDLIVLNATLGRGLARLRIVRKGEGFTWEASAEREALERPLWPVARSAADLRGNRAKARRYYERRRSTSRPRAGALRS